MELVELIGDGKAGQLVDFEKYNAPTPGVGETDLPSILKARIDEAVDYAEEELAAARKLEQQYYDGDTMPGDDDLDSTRSKFISKDVRDTIKAILPSLLRIFCSGKSPVEYQAVGAEDEPWAQQATDYVSHVVLQQDNNIHHILYEVFHDALLKATGTIMWCWEDNFEVVGQEYAGLSEMQYRMILADENVTAINVTNEYQDEFGMPRFDCEVNYKKYNGGKIKIYAVPPEERLINKRARDVEDSRLYGRRQIKTVSELVAMGYDYNQVVQMGGNEELDTNEEKTQRYGSLIFDQDPNDGDPSQRQLMYYDIYTRIDLDGDGFAELYRFACAGNACEILRKKDGTQAKELVNEIPMAEMCPDPIPHLATGKSTANAVMDVQRTKTNIFRAILDSLSRSIFPDKEVVPTQVNMQDLLNPEIGRVIRVNAPGMIREITTTFMGKEAMPVLDYMDNVKVNRTGLTSVSQGLDPQALQSTNAAGIEHVSQASQAQIEMIARIFALGGMKKLFRGLLKMIKTHQDQVRTVKLRNEWVDINPSMWEANMDVTVNTALGRGTDAQKIATLRDTADRQAAILEKLGPINPMCTFAEYRNTLAQIIELEGFPNADLFYLPVNHQQVMQQAMQQFQQLQQRNQELEGQLNMAALQLRNQSDAKDALNQASATEKYVGAFKELIEGTQMANNVTVAPNAAHDELRAGGQFLGRQTM